MNKEEIIKLISQLDKQDLFDLTNNLNNLTKMINKSKDTLFLRYIGLRGYKSIKDFWLKYGITRDSSLDSTIKDENDSLTSYFKLKEILNIDDETFKNFIKTKVKEIGNSNE